MSLLRRIPDALVWVLAAQPFAALYAQAPERVSIYRFVLDMDVPEPPALVAMSLAPIHVLRASAPKPLAASVFWSHDSAGGTTTGVALDLAPYFLFGGGIRTLSSYRSMSIKGRLLRVLTKTTLSLGAAVDPAERDATRLGIGLRSTFHDPHDPIGSSRLPERVAEALARQGVEPGVEEEDLAGLGVDLRPLYAEASREVRARPGPQIAGGWGVTGWLRSAVVSEDSLEKVSHTAWLTTQYTLGSRFDLLATAQAINVFDDNTHLRAGAAVQRKTTTVDLIAELYWDSSDDEFHPGAWIEARLLPRLRVGASLSAEPDPHEESSRLRIRTLLRWYSAP